MIKAAIFVGIFFLLGSLDIAQSQIALSSYFCESAIKTVDCDFFSQSLSNFAARNSRRTKRDLQPVVPVGICKGCSRCLQPSTKRVLSPDRRALPFTYTYCTRAISLDVGFDIALERTFFIAINCGGSLYFSLDPTKTTRAAEFYYSCIDSLLYKCPTNQVFDQVRGTCVPNYGVLDIGLPCFKACNLSPMVIPLSQLACESKISNTLKPACATCKTPFEELAITPGEPSTIKYTFCAENGRFSLDTDTGNYNKAFFTPYCTGTNKLVPLDSYKYSYAAKFFWDCNLGLISCVSGAVFDPATNRCVYPTVVYNPDSGPYCQKTCPATYSAQYATGSPMYYPPTSAYGK